MGLTEPYFGTFVPKETPKEIVTKLSEVIKKVTEDPQYKERMKKIYFRVEYADTKALEISVESQGKEGLMIYKKLGLMP